MLNITQEHLQIFRKIREQYYNSECTLVPKEGNWKSMSDNDIWLRIITQVIVAGKAEPANKFNNDIELKESVSYKRLLQINDEEEIKEIINYVLRAVGARYASSDIKKCKKTNSLLHNFKVLNSYSCGPKELFIKLDCYKGSLGDKQKINYLMTHLKFMQSKNARDFLLETGVIRNAIAFDNDIRNIFTYLEIELPEKFESKPKMYDEIEKEVLAKICKPLDLDGVEFDRMLFQNYSKIVKQKITKTICKCNTKSNQIEEEQMTESHNSTSNEIRYNKYNLDYHLNKTNKKLGRLFLEIRENILHLPNIQEVFEIKTGITYRTADIKNSISLARFHFRKKYINVILKFEKYEDPEKIVRKRNVSSPKVIHKGEIIIDENSDINYIVNLIKQTYEMIQ